MQTISAEGAIHCRIEIDHWLISRLRYQRAQWFSRGRFTPNPFRSSQKIRFRHRSCRFTGAMLLQPQRQLFHL